MSDPIDVPWKVRSPQQQGMQTEKTIAKKRGARLHPRSGAGNIKEDMSTDDEVIEVKDANLTYSLKASELETVFKRAARQGKEGQFVVYFRSNGIRADITIRRGKE